MRVLHSGGARSVGEENWVATAAIGFNQSAYYFHDNHACLSPRITVSATDFVADVVFDDIQTRAGLGLPAGALTSGLSGNDLVAVGTQRKVHKGTLRVSAATDPSLRLQVLTDWHDGELWLGAYLAQQLAVSSDWYSPYYSDAEGGYGQRSGRAFFEAAVANVFTDVFGRSQRPEGWNIWLEKEELLLQAHESIEVPIHLETPSPGYGAFAVKVLNTEFPGESVITAPVEILAI